LKQQINIQQLIFLSLYIPINSQQMSAPRRDKTSTTLTFFNIIKAYLGSGLLVIPCKLFLIKS